MKKNQLLPLLLCLLWSTCISAQFTVSGKVTSESEPEGVIGAAVLVKGNSDLGTTTDIDGFYSLEVPDANSILIFSYVGLKDMEISVEARKTLDVVMEEGLVLDEVVVVGYGTQKKKVVTGAISKVKAEDLENMPVTRLEGSLQGRTSGVRVTTDSGQPGSGSTVRIRGTTTTGSGNNPLYVVDGVPIEGGIDYLAQGDIESIEVLKDASAGIYGARSATGVILVTTKKGKAGVTRLNYNGYYGTQNPWRKLRLLNSTEYATLLNEASVADGGSLFYPDPEALGEGTDWQEAVFNENAPIQNHELSLSTGSEKSTFFLSFSYFDQEGIVSEDDSKFKRYTVRLNSEHKVKERFKFGNTLAYTRIKATGVTTNSEFGSPLSRAINIDPLTPIYETDPDVLSSSVFTNFPVVSDENGVFGISDLVTSEIVNPLAALEVQQGFGHSDKIVGNFYGELTLMEGLKARTSLGGDIAFFGGAGFSPVFYLNASTRNDVNNYGRQKAQGVKLILENTLSYSKVFGDHDLSVILGQSVERNEGNSINGTIQDIPATSLDEASFGFFNVAELQRFGGYEYEDRIASYFGRATYNFRQKYLLSLVLRADGSSRFGGNNKFGYFPSVSAGWVVTEEDFLINSPIVNFLKIRGSWGINGNNGIPNFAYVSTLGEGKTYTFGTGDNLINGVGPNGLANPDLRWEETTQTNFGIDAVLFKGVNMTVDFYQKNTDGILGAIYLPGFFGNFGGLGNVGSLFNRGVELELGYDNKVGDFDVKVYGNVTYNQNEVTFIDSEATFVPGQRVGPQGLEVTRFSVGESFGYLFGFKTDGLFQNQSDINNHAGEGGVPLQPEAQPGDIKFVDFNGDGVLTDDDRTKIGDAIPDWTYGFNVNLEYKNFDLLFFGQGVFGNEIYNATRRYDLTKSNSNADALTRWTGEGTSDRFPRMTLLDANRNFSRSSDFFVTSGAFFRIKTMQIGYTLPKDLVERAGMQKVRFYVSGNNLLTVTKYQGFDPEISGGVDRGIYPQARFFLFGLNVGL